MSVSFQKDFKPLAKRFVFGHKLHNFFGLKLYIIFKIPNVWDFEQTKKPQKQNLLSKIYPFLGGFFLRLSFSILRGQRRNFRAQRVIYRFVIQLIWFLLWQIGDHQITLGAPTA